jgi:hypothetical protein
MSKLEVALNGTVISNTVIFEYKTNDAFSRLESLSTSTPETSLSLLNNVEQTENYTTALDNNKTTIQHNLYLCHDEGCQRILKTMLLQRIDDLLTHLEEVSNSSKLTDSNHRRSSLMVMRASNVFEDYLVTLVKHLSQRKWKSTKRHHQGTATAKAAANHQQVPNLLYLSAALGLAE